MSWFTSELTRLAPNIGSLDIGGKINAFNEMHSEVIGTIHERGMSDFNKLWATGHGGMSFDDTMSEGANLFSSGREQISGSLDTASDYASSRWEGAGIGWDQEEGILGLGSPNATIPTVGGSSSPNLEQFSIGDKNFQKIMGKLQGRGYLHELIPAIANPEHAIGLHDPRNWKDHVDTILGGAISGKEQELLQSLTDSASSALTPSEEEEEEKVKGPGTLRGREATLKLNLGAKGLGRKSLRIGTKGMGKPKTGKYRTYKSGRRTES